MRDVHDVGARSTAPTRDTICRPRTPSRPAKSRADRRTPRERPARGSPRV